MSHVCVLKFLDLLIYEHNGGLATEVYYKPTDCNNLLQYQSFHPRALRDNLPVGQFLRLRRNCSSVTDYRKHADKLTTKLHTKDYPPHLVSRARKRARNNNRDQLLQPEHRNQTSRRLLLCLRTGCPLALEGPLPLLLGHLSFLLYFTDPVWSGGESERREVTVGFTVNRFRFKQVLFSGILFPVSEALRATDHPASVLGVRETNSPSSKCSCRVYCPNFNEISGICSDMCPNVAEEITVSAHNKVLLYTKYTHTPVFSSE
ncbi:hypothetical protein NDU88_006911 [Pleurodeles waltl]|uniref:Helix-turn-helix domain-containing protein n=1 Tax=Pleurodeles waltl TaxID=8319 RepID=A0AAV7VSB6_PLEWA|nr:hypothetical protein NDU88_006911 [Pleurodeles waltl]